MGLPWKRNAMRSKPAPEEQMLPLLLREVASQSGQNERGGQTKGWGRGEEEPCLMGTELEFEKMRKFRDGRS